jgi:hypothetical protein
VSNGNQGIYGVGEVIASFPDTPAGLRRAMRRAAYWWRPAVVRDAAGNSVDIDYPVVRDRDRGYTMG